MEVLPRPSHARGRIPHNARQCPDAPQQGTGLSLRRQSRPRACLKPQTPGRAPLVTHPKKNPNKICHLGALSSQVAAAVPEVESEFVRIGVCFSADQAICHHTEVLRLSAPLLVPDCHPVLLAAASSLCFQKSVLRKQSAGSLFAAGVQGVGAGLVRTQVASWTSARTRDVSMPCPAARDWGALTRPQYLCRSVHPRAHAPVPAFSFWL